MCGIAGWYDKNLELIRMERIKIEQDDLFCDITIDYLANDIAPIEDLALS